jgi:hypothetical protein
MKSHTADSIRNRLQGVPKAVRALMWGKTGGCGAGCPRERAERPFQVPIDLLDMG